MHVDARGLGWMKCGPNQTYPKQFMEQLEALHYKRPPWSTAFPDIDTTTTPCAPTLNVVSDNRYCFPKSKPPPPPPPPPAPPPGPGCAKCPPGHLYGYGDPVNGHWCCSAPVDGPPTGASCPSKSICCLKV